jgi:hypothetical protein
MKHGGRNFCHFFPDVLFQINRCPWFLFVHLALEISSKKVLRLGTLVPINIEVPTKYPLSHNDRIVVFDNRLHCKSPMLYRPALHGNWNALSLARRALKKNSPRQRFHSQLCCKIVRYFCRILYIRYRKQPDFHPARPVFSNHPPPPGDDKAVWNWSLTARQGWGQECNWVINLSLQTSLRHSG